MKKKATLNVRVLGRTKLGFQMLDPFGHWIAMTMDGNELKNFSINLMRFCVNCGLMDKEIKEIKTNKRRKKNGNKN